MYPFDFVSGIQYTKVQKERRPGWHLAGVADGNGNPKLMWQERDETGQLISFSSENKHCRCDSCIKYI